MGGIQEFAAPFLHFHSAYDNIYYQFVLVNFTLCILRMPFHSHKTLTSNMQEHVSSCKFKKIPCPNKQYGCTKLLLQSQWEEHLERECRFIPVQCPWCSKKVHNKEVSKLTKHANLKQRYIV